MVVERDEGSETDTPPKAYMLPAAQLELALAGYRVPTPPDAELPERIGSIRGRLLEEPAGIELERMKLRLKELLSSFPTNAAVRHLLADVQEAISRESLRELRKSAPKSVVNERLLRAETIRLLSGSLKAKDPSILLADAFHLLPNDPSASLQASGPPADLASQWFGVLWDCDCMDGHSPLYRLLSTCYDGKRDPRINGFKSFSKLLDALDEPCR